MLLTCNTLCIREIFSQVGTELLFCTCKFEQLIFYIQGHTGYNLNILLYSLIPPATILELINERNFSSKSLKVSNLFSTNSTHNAGVKWFF